MARAGKPSSPPKYEGERPVGVRPVRGPGAAAPGRVPGHAGVGHHRAVGWHGSASWLRQKIAALRTEYAPKTRLTGSLPARGPGPVRPVVPAGGGAAGSPAVWVAAAAGDGGLALEVHHRPDAPVPAYRGPAGRTAGRGAAAAGLGQRGRHRQRRALAEGVAAFTGVLPARIVQLRPYDPEYKGIVERANGDL